VEQATLVRQTTAKEELNGPVLRDCCLVPAQGRERDSNEEYARAVGLNEDELRMLAEIATGVTTDVVARRLDLSARTPAPPPPLDLRPSWRQHPHRSGRLGRPPAPDLARLRCADTALYATTRPWTSKAPPATRPRSTPQRRFGGSADGAVAEIRIS